MKDKRDRALFDVIVAIRRLSQECETGRIELVNLAQDIKASPRLGRAIDRVKASSVSVCMSSAFERINKGMCETAAKKGIHQTSKAPTTSGDEGGPVFDGYVLAGNALGLTLNAACRAIGAGGSVLEFFANGMASICAGIYELGG